MGITGIFPLIRKLCPGCIRKCKLEDYRGKSVAIDTNAFVYRFLYGQDKGRHLYQFGEFFCDLVASGIDPFFVVDGPSPEEKAAVQAKRNAIRQKHIKETEEKKQELKRKKIEEGIIEEDGTPKKVKLTPEKEKEIKEMEKAVAKFEHSKVIVSKEDIDDIKELLRLMGAKVIQAHSEGEAVCAVLNRLGKVDAVISEDSDVFAYGGSKLITGVGAKSNRETDMMEYDIPAIMEKMELTPEMFIELSILCGCDFSSKIEGIGAITGYKKLKTEGKLTVENVIQSMKPEEKAKKIPADFDPCGARKVFYSFLYKSDLYDYVKDETQKYDHDAVVKLLKGKMPQYRERSADWCERLTGVYPTSVYYGEDEDME